MLYFEPEPDAPPDELAPPVLPAPLVPLLAPPLVSDDVPVEEPLPMPELLAPGDEDELEPLGEDEEEPVSDVP